MSIHIINYNHGRFLREAIDGALAQDYPNVEVVITDDASTDDSVAIIQDYAARNPGKIVPVLNPTNLGITRNSNAGLKHCSGELIAFTDSDDILLPGKITKQVEWFQKRPDGALCGHQAEVFYEDGNKAPHPLSPKLVEGIGADTLIRSIPFGKTTIMVRADRIPAHGFDERLPVVSDLLMWVDVVRTDGRFGYVEGTFARYRRHARNVTGDELANLDQVSRYFAILRERYPMYSAVIDRAESRRLAYDVGVAHLHKGDRRAARALFVRALRHEPLWARAWVRLAQTL